MYADNVVLAKVHALYGRRLTGRDYQQLMQKKSVSEVAGYLKAETDYADTLREIREELVHRGQLEIMVHRHRTEIYTRLLKYDLEKGFFRRLYARRIEIEQLLAAMRLLSAGKMDQYVADFPSYLNHCITFDLFRLAKIKSFDDLLDVVKQTAYYTLLGAFRPVERGGGVDLPGCEAALLTSYYEGAISSVRGLYRGRTRKDLETLLRVQIDQHNIQVIYRLKRVFRFTPDEIRAYLIPIKSNLSKAVLDKMVEAQSAEQVAELLRSAYPVWRGLITGTRDLGFAAQHVRRETCRKAFRFSSHPIVVLMAYMALTEFEGENVVNIIEGIRYALTPDEIRELLIL